MAGFPPETWVRVKATVKHHTESPTHDFCPVCGADVNAFDIGLSGTPIVQPKARSKKKSEDLDEVDHGE
jgi:hypothetical protein